MLRPPNTLLLIPLLTRLFWSLLGRWLSPYYWTNSFRWEAGYGLGHAVSDKKMALRCTLYKFVGERLFSFCESINASSSSSIFSKLHLSCSILRKSSSLTPSYPSTPSFPPSLTSACTCTLVLLLPFLLTVFFSTPLLPYPPRSIQASARLNEDELNAEELINNVRCPAPSWMCHPETQK